MKISEFLSTCRIHDTAMNEVSRIHPKQLISDEIPVPIWKVHYAYETARGNKKETDKYCIDYDYSFDRVTQSTFPDYIKEFNENFPERRLSNVEILDAAFLGEVFIELE